MDTQTLLNQLKSLALDLIWSWTHKGDKIWETLDPVLWDLTRNPWDILQTVSAEKLALAWKDKEFQETVEQLFQRNEEISQTPGWFDHTHKKSPLSCIAYFSMEYMLSEALPIYSGGLGNVAGDQLKAASDLGVPVIGIGLLYQQGYFRQMIDKDGNQQAFYPFNDPGQLPIKPMRKPNGEWLRIEFSFPGYSIWIRVWEVQIGKVRLYLLDSNDPANFPLIVQLPISYMGMEENYALCKNLF
jgi:starch phosphorylase